MNSTRRLILSAAVLLLLISSTSAQDNKGKKVDYTGTQEVDISVGLPYGSLFRDASVVGDAFAGFNFISPSDIVTETTRPYCPHSGPSTDTTSSAGSASYRMLYKEDNSHAWDEWTHLATATFNVKFYWLNRKWVRMYSGVGVGLGIVSTNAGAENEEEAAGRSTKLLPTFDLRLIGLTVGQRLYGRFEVGTLNTGLVSAGIGYRF